jgi:hypothetical protein
MPGVRNFSQDAIAERWAESIRRYEGEIAKLVDWAATARACLVDCDSELSAQARHRPPSDEHELLALSFRCRGLCHSLPVPFSEDSSNG